MMETTTSIVEFSRTKRGRVYDVSERLNIAN